MKKIFCIVVLLLFVSGSLLAASGDVVKTAPTKSTVTKTETKISVTSRVNQTQKPNHVKMSFLDHLKFQFRILFGFGFDIDVDDTVTPDGPDLHGGKGCDPLREILIEDHGWGENPI